MDIENETMLIPDGKEWLVEMWLELSEVLAAKPTTIIPIVFAD